MSFRAYPHRFPRFPLGIRPIRPFLLGLGLGLLPVAACAPLVPGGPGNFSTLNSRYQERQPALSGDGRLVAYVTDRGGTTDLVVFDLENNRFVPLPGLNRRNMAIDSPSLSRSGRYIVYLAQDRGRLEVQLYDRATSRIQRLTQGYRGWLRNPSISADGRYVTVETARRGQWDIEVFDRGMAIEPDLTDPVP